MASKKLIYNLFCILGCVWEKVLKTVILSQKIKWTEKRVKNAIKCCQVYFDGLHLEYYFWRKGRNVKLKIFLLLIPSVFDILQETWSLWMGLFFLLANLKILLSHWVFLPNKLQTLAKKERWHFTSIVYEDFSLPRFYILFCFNMLIQNLCLKAL